MIVYENEHEYSNRVLNLLGDDYKNHLRSGNTNIDDVRLRFLVSQGYFNDIQESELADRIKQKFPFIKEKSNEQK